MKLLVTVLASFPPSLLSRCSLAHSPSTPMLRFRQARAALAEHFLQPHSLECRHQWPRRRQDACFWDVHVD